MLVLYEYGSKELISHLKTRAIESKGKRGFVIFQGARGKGAMAWVTCEEVHRGEWTTPDMYREIIGRCPLSNDEYVSVCGKC